MNVASHFWDTIFYQTNLKSEMTQFVDLREELKIMQLTNKLTH